MVRFETLKSESIGIGGNNFIEVAHKKAITSDGENEFISISRGFVTRENEKRFKKSIAIPFDKEVVENLREALQKMTE